MVHFVRNLKGKDQFEGFFRIHSASLQDNFYYY